MPQPREHVSWADKNETFAKSFSLRDQLEVNWSITMLFYSALHYVDAYIVSRGGARQDHSARSQFMQNAFFDDIRVDYKKLKDMSREARYNIAQFSKQDVEKADRLLQRIKNHIRGKIR